MDGNPEFVTPPAGRTEVVAPPVIKKVSWGAIFVGAFVSLAVLATLALLGFAVGLGSFNPDRYVNPLAGITVGTGIWWLIISIIAFFVGGWVSSRLITPLYQSENVLHGVASWAVASLALVVMAGTAAGVIMGGGLGVLSSTVRANGPGNLISSTFFGGPMWNGQGWGYPAYGSTGWGYNPSGSYNSGTNYGGQGMGGNTGTGYTGSSSTGMNNSGSSSYPNGTTSTDTGSYSRSTYGNYGTPGTTGNVSGSTSGSSDMSNTGTSDQNAPRYGKTHKGKSSTGTSSSTYGTSTDNTGTSSNTYGTSGTSGSSTYGTSGTSGTSSNTYGGTSSNMGTYGGSGMGSMNSPYNSNYANAQMRQIATQAAHTAATAAGWTFVMLILSLAAAALGAGLSAPKNIPTARNMP